MPFTFSHPALVLPLTYLPKRWFSLTGLIVGSLVTDFEYFIKMKMSSEYSHTLGGLFWFDLPLGLLLAYLFHNVVRNMLFDNLPILLKSRLYTFTSFDWNNYAKKHFIVVCLSILVGAFSHVLWDSFTHQDGYFVQLIPFLSTKTVILGKSISTFKIFQYSSTILGGSLVLLSLFLLPKNAHITVEINIKYYLLVILIAFVAVLLRIWSGIDYKMYGHLIVIIISGIILGLILTPLILSTKQT